MQLHRCDVVAAATTILDNHGIADLTMRRLARELGISPGALYWHFTSKQQLLGAVADRVLAPVCAGAERAGGTGWQARVTAVCTRMRDALLAYTDGAELVSASLAAGQSAQAAEILGMLTTAAADAGLSPQRAALAARTLVHYVLGATADEQSRLQWDAAGALPEDAAGSAAIGSLIGAPDPSAGFGFGLELLIDGLAVQARRSAPERVLDPLAAVPPS